MQQGQGLTDMILYYDMQYYTFIRLCVYTVVHKKYDPGRTNFPLPVLRAKQHFSITLGQQLGQKLQNNMTEMIDGVVASSGGGDRGLLKRERLENNHHANPL